MSLVMREELKVKSYLGSNLVTVGFFHSSLFTLHSREAGFPCA
jgi:hypothetical protein